MSWQVGVATSLAFREPSNASGKMIAPDGVIVPLSPNDPNQPLITLSLPHLSDPFWHKRASLPTSDASGTFWHQRASLQRVMWRGTLVLSRENSTRDLLRPCSNLKLMETIEITQNTT